MTEVAIIAALVCAGALAFAALLYRKCVQVVPPDKALIVTGGKGPRVFLEKGVTIPVLHRKEWMDLSIKKVEVVLENSKGVHCRDYIRANVRATFLICIPPDERDILAVAKSIGTERASRPETLEQLFTARFSEAIQSTFKRLEFEEILEQHDRVLCEIANFVGDDLGGYRLKDVALESIAQTPQEHLNPDDILDARGLQKIATILADTKAATPAPYFPPVQVPPSPVVPSRPSQTTQAEAPPSPEPEETRTEPEKDTTPTPSALSAQEEEPVIEQEKPVWTPVRRENAPAPTLKTLAEAEASEVPTSTPATNTGEVSGTLEDALLPQELKPATFDDFV